MRSLVRMDEKGRVQIPKKIRSMMKLKARQPIFMELKDNVVVFSRAVRPDASKDKLLKDILIKPGHSKIRLTRKLLDRLKEEAWTP